MSALLKAIGVYLAVVVPLVAWIGGTIWSIATGDPFAPFIAFAPVYLFLVAVIVYVIIIQPIAALYHHFKEGK